MSIKLRSKSLYNYYSNNPDEYMLKFHHYNIIVENESDEEYNLLDRDINTIRKYNKDNSIIYFSDLDNLSKVMYNTKVFDYLDDIFLRIRNNEEYEKYKKLKIDINLIVEINDINSINLQNDKIILQIDSIKELSVSKLFELKKHYNIIKILVGQITYITKEYDYLLDILSKQFGISVSNQLELEKNNEVTNDIYNVELYVKMMNKIEDIISMANKKDNINDKIKFIFYYLACNIYYDENGVIKTNIENQNLIGPLFKKMAVCEGYSKLFKQILSLFNIECLIVSGGSGKESGGHVWNQIKIEDKWYNADVTAQSYAVHNNKNNSMFLVKDELCMFLSSSPFAKKCLSNYYSDEISENNEVYEELLKK